MVIFWNHTLVSLHYSQYYHQRLEVGVPCLGLWSTEEHKKWQVFTYFLILTWRWTQCGQQLWNLTAPLPWSPRCSPDVPKALAEAAVSSVGLGVQGPGWNKSHKPCLASLPGVQPHTCPAQLLLCPGHRAVHTPQVCHGSAGGRCSRCDLNFIFPEGPEKQKAAKWTQEPGIRILVLIYDFIMPWVNSLN